MRIATTIFLLSMASATGAFASSLTIDPPYPLRGDSAQLQVDDAASELEVTVTYRPNSRTAVTDSLGTVAPGATLSWAPRIAGLAQLEARDGDQIVASRAVSVRAGSFAISGLLIMTMAFVLLFGGAAAGFLLLLRR